MTDFRTHDAASAPEKARPILERTAKAYGFVPNLIGVLAEAPTAVKGYATLAGIFEETDLSPSERQVVLLTVSRYHECRYCMAAHSVVAGMRGVDDAVIAAVRNDRPIAEPKLEALRQFTRTMVERRGVASEADIAALIGAGYTKATVLEVILGIAMKTISNYTNHVAGTELDAAFAEQRWTGPGEAAA